MPHPLQSTCMTGKTKSVFCPAAGRSPHTLERALPGFTSVKSTRVRDTEAGMRVANVTEASAMADYPDEAAYCRAG